MSGNKRTSEKTEKSKKFSNGNINSSPEKLGSEKRKKKNINKGQLANTVNKSEILLNENGNKTISSQEESYYDDLLGFYSENDSSRPDGVLELKISNISKYKEQDFRLDTKVLSPEPVLIRCLPWKILFMLRMQQDRNQRCMGFFLQCNAKSESTVWHCHAKAELRLVAQRKSSINAAFATSTPDSTSPISSPTQCADLVKNIEHNFFYRENDWGYSNFISWSDLVNPEKGYIGTDDSVILRVKVQADAPHGIDWDSKKHTGFVGLKNQGATCYMNSLLQALYFTNKLRRAVYQLPTETDDEQRSVSLALQRVFFELQFGEKAVGTKRLTKSFGWETLDTFMQHDAQELCRVLLDNLECKMKGTRVEDTIPNLFCGKMMSFIRCKNVSVESRREEAFYDIQLKVKGNNDIYQAFDEYIAIETLDGDNKYDAGEYGMQDAEKGIVFLKFPPVLYLQLMRFQYDYEADANIKINDRFEFPYSLDLSKYLQNSEGDTRYKYILHTVLVHSGDNHGGHYVAYLNPYGRNEWYKFDDDVVSRCSRRDAIISNYGGNDEDTSMKQCTNAYMLVYMCESEADDLLVPVEDEDIPLNLRQRFANEKFVEDQKRKEKANAHLYSTALLLLDEDFYGWQGYELFDMERYMYWRRLKYPRKSNATETTQLVANFLHEKVDRIRLWCIISKHGQIQLTPLENKDSLPLNDSTIMYVQTLPADQPSRNLRHSLSLSSSSILAFIKFYDPYLQFIQYLGWININVSNSTVNYNSHNSGICIGSVKELATQLCKRAHLYDNTPLILWDERERKEICRLSSSSNNTISVSANLINGIIIVCEPDLTAFLNVNLNFNASLKSTNPFKQSSHTINSRFSTTNNYSSCSFSPSPSSLNLSHMNAIEFLHDLSQRILVEFVEKISELTNRDCNNKPNLMRVVIKLSLKARYMDILKALVARIKDAEVSKMQLYRASLTSNVLGNNHAANQNGLLSSSPPVGAENDKGSGKMFHAGDPIRTTFDGCLADLVSGSTTSMNATLPRGKPLGPLLAATAAANGVGGGGGGAMCGSGAGAVLSHNTSQQQPLSVTAESTTESPSSLKSVQCQDPEHNHYYRTNVASFNNGGLALQQQQAKILYFQRLKIPITEVETMHQFLCCFVDCHAQRQLDVTVSLARAPSTSGANLLTEALRQARLSGTNDASRWRMFEVIDHRINQQITHEKKLSDLEMNPNRIIQIEAMAPGEEKVTSKEMLVAVCHGQLDTNTYFGIPFSIKVRDDEPVSELRQRIRSRIDNSSKEFDKWSLAVVTHLYEYSSTVAVGGAGGNNIVYLISGSSSSPDQVGPNIRLSLFDMRHSYDNSSISLTTDNCIIAPRRPWICLDHKVPTVKRTRTGASEKPIKIHN